MVNNHSDSERGNPLPPHGLLFPISYKGSFICTIPDRIAHTTAFVIPVVEHWLEREITQWVHHEGSIRRPIAPWANALTTELHLAPLVPRSAYPIMILNIVSANIFFPLGNMIGMVWSHSVKPVLGDWQSSYRRCRKDEVVLWYARIGHLTQSSTSVWALSVYSDSSPHFGGVQSFISSQPPPATDSRRTARNPLYPPMKAVPLTSSPFFPVPAKAGTCARDRRAFLLTEINEILLALFNQFLVPTSAPRLVQQRPWYVLSCLWQGVYKRTLAANRKD